MPAFQVPAISNNQYADGTTISVGDSVVPVLVVTDANNKVAITRGSPIAIQDVTSPVITGFQATQAGNSYEFSVSAGTVSDNVNGTVSLTLVLSTSSLTDAQVEAAAPSASAGAKGSVGYSGSPVALPSLASSDAWNGSAFVAIDSGTASVYAYMLAEDQAGNTAVATATGSPITVMAPAVSLTYIASSDIVAAGTDITADGNGVLTFNGTSSYFRMQELDAQLTTSYGDAVRADTWSTAFWIRPFVQPQTSGGVLSRFLCFRDEGTTKIIIVDNRDIRADSGGTLYVTDFQINTWYHVAVSADAGQYTFYVNGSNVASTPYTLVALPSTRMFIGVNNGGGDAPLNVWWNGNAYNMYFSDSPLTQTDVSNMYADTPPV